MGVDSADRRARRIRQPIVTQRRHLQRVRRHHLRKGRSRCSAMFERFVGPEKFRAGIRHYLTQHANGNATADDFISAIATARGPRRDAGVQDVPRSAGHAAGRRLGDRATRASRRRMHVKQQRFLPVGSKGSADHTWQIPMCVRWIGGDAKSERGTAAAQRQCTLVTQKEQDITLGSQPGCPTWLLANDGEVGYYRAAYPGDAAGEAARARRAQAAGSRRRRWACSTICARWSTRGACRSATRSALTPSLSQDERRHVQRFVIGALGGLREHLVPDAEHANYVRVINKIYGRSAHTLGWVPKPGEDEDTRLLRAGPGRAGRRRGRGQGAAGRGEGAGAQVAGRSQSRQPRRRGQGLEVAARNGDRALFDKLHAEAKQATDRHDRQRCSARWASSAIRRSPSRRCRWWRQRVRSARVDGDRVGPDSEWSTRSWRGTG